MDSRPIGRDAEIAEIWAFIFSCLRGASRAVDHGDAGIGKMLIWHNVLQARVALEADATMAKGYQHGGGPSRPAASHAKRRYGAVSPSSRKKHQ